MAAVSAAAPAAAEADHRCLGALRELARRRLPPTPRNYRVFYLYASGRMPRLNTLLDKLAAPDGSLDEGKLEQLHDVFAVGWVSQGGLRHVVKDVNALLTNLQNGLGILSSRAGRLIEEIGDGGTTTAPASAARAAAATTRLAVDHLERIAVEQSARMGSLRRALREAEDEAQRDELTGLGNRGAFDRQIATSVEQAAATQRGFALALADIDHFKAVNDTHGHMIGDRVLKLVAGELRRTGQAAFRIGGEEFALLLPLDDPTPPVAVAEALRRRIAQLRIVRRGDRAARRRITLSLGVATWHPDDAPAALFERADRALYAAKRGGRNRVSATPAPCPPPVPRG